MGVPRFCVKQRCYRPPACPRAAAVFSVKKIMFRRLFPAQHGILWWCRMNDELTLA
jgi:hypothetical protein